MLCTTCYIQPPIRMKLGCVNYAMHYFCDAPGKRLSAVSRSKTRAVPRLRWTSTSLHSKPATAESLKTPLASLHSRLASC